MTHNKMGGYHRRNSNFHL